MAVPYTFQNATGSLPLSQLDTNFATGITIGNTSVVLGDTITLMNNMSLANVAINSVSVAFPNGYLANSSVTLGNTSVSLGSTATTLNGLTLSNVTISTGNVTINTATVTTANVTTLNVSGNTTLGDASSDTVTINSTTTFNASPVISVTDNTNAALRVTQLGTGNALLVEDSTNPDSTPFVIDANGKVIEGATSAFNTAPSLTAQITVGGTTSGTSAIGIGRFSNDASQTYLAFAKSRNTTVGTYGVAVQSGDAVGTINWSGDDGTSPISLASISASVDVAPSTGIVQGRLVFSTANSSGTLTEVMRIGSAQTVSIGSGTVTGVVLNINKTITGATTSYGTRINSQVQSDVTSNVRYFATTVNTQATAFTLGSISHFYAEQGTFGAGSTVTNQYGFLASALSGATNNYGFYGQVVSATGAYNLYMSGTADNYLAGKTGIGTTPATGQILRVGGSLTGGTTARQVAAVATIASDVTARADTFLSVPATAASAFTIGILSHYHASQGTIGATSAVTTQIGFEADSSITGATTNIGFYGDIAAASGRWNFYASGTANNYMAGALGIGTTSLTNVNFRLSKTITGSTTSYGLLSEGVVQSDATSAGRSIASGMGTQATAFTVGNLSQFYAFQGTIGAGSTVTNQFGFVADSTLIGATNNYGFYSNIASGTGRYNFYAAGTADNYFAGNVGIGTSSPTAVVTIKAGTATANTAPVKLTSGTNLTTPEAGAVEYDGTVFYGTTDTNFKRGTLPLTNYSSGTGTALGTNTEATNAVLLPSANDTITLSIGTYFLDTSFIVTRGATSVTSATARINIRGTGAAVGSFSGMSLSAPTAGGATANFSFDAVNITTDNVLTAASTTAAGVYTISLRGVLKVTTSGTIIPQYSLSANINAAGTVAKVLYFRLQQMDTQSAAAAGPAGTGWA